MSRINITRGLGVMFMTLGMADLTVGVFAATRISHEKRRLDRWERAREDGITDLELAHFEGELQASQDTRQGERLVVRWGGLTHALGGLLVLAFTPIPDSMSGSRPRLGLRHRQRFLRGRHGHLRGIVSRYPKREGLAGIQQAEDADAGARVQLGHCPVGFQAGGRPFVRRHVLVATGLRGGPLSE